MSDVIVASRQFGSVLTGTHLLQSEIIPLCQNRFNFNIFLFETGTHSSQLVTFEAADLVCAIVI